MQAPVGGVLHRKSLCGIARPLFCVARAPRREGIDRAVSGSASVAVAEAAADAADAVDAADAMDAVDASGALADRVWTCAWKMRVGVRCEILGRGG